MRPQRQEREKLTGRIQRLQGACCLTRGEGLHALLCTPQLIPTTCRHWIACISSATPRRPHRGIVQQLLDSIREAYGDDPDKACAEFGQEVRKAWSNIGEQWASTGSDTHTRIKSSLTQLQKNLESPRRLRTLEDEHAWASQKKALLVSCATSVVSLNTFSGDLVTNGSVPSSRITPKRITWPF